MAPPKKVDTLKRYQGELQRSISWRNSDDLDGLWRRMIDLYKGKHYSTNSHADRMVVNRAFSLKNIVAPSIAVNNPKFLVDARKPDQAPQAMVTQEVINYLWRAWKYKKQFRLAVDDYLITGHGWLKVGYKFKKEAVEIKRVPDAPGSEQDGDSELGVDDRDPVEGNVETEMKVVDDRPFVERISVFDIFVDPDARNEEEMRWIAQRVKRNVADVRVDSRYSPTHRGKIAAAERDVWDSSKDDGNVAPDMNAHSHGFVDVWEFYDLRENKVCTFVSAYEDGFLIDPKPIPYALGHPFLMLRNYEVPDQFYPMGELEAVEILQLELNETRSEMMMHRRRHARKYLYAEEAFTGEGALDKLKSDVDNTMVPVNTAAVELDAAVRPMPTTQISADQYNMSEVIEGDIDVVAGLNDYMRGGPTANIRRTATEAAMIQDQQNARSSDKLAGIEEFLADVGEALVGLLQQYMTEPQVVRIVGSQAQPTWITYDKDYIAGKFDFSVEAGSTQPQNESFRAQRAMQLMDAMSPFLQMGVADPIAVMRKVLQDGFGVKDPSMFIAQQGPQPGGGAPGPGMPPGMPPGPEGDMAEPQSEIAGIPQELLSRLDVQAQPALAA